VERGKGRVNGVGVVGKWRVRGVIRREKGELRKEKRKVGPSQMTAWISLWPLSLYKYI